MQLRAQLFLFCFMDNIGREERSNLWKIIIFSAFSRLGLFPYVFGQVNEWSTLKLHEVIRVLQVVAFPIISILFEDWDWQGGVLKVMKNDHFLVILAVWVLLPKFLGRLRSHLC